MAGQAALSGPGTERVRSYLPRLDRISHSGVHWETTICDPVSAFRAAIWAALGHAPKTIVPGRFGRFPTSDRRRDDAGWCKLFADLRGGVFGCYRRGLSETWSANDQRTMLPRQRMVLARQVDLSARERLTVQREAWAVNARRIADTLGQSVPLAPGDPAVLYLQRRVGDRWPLPACLRLHRALPYWHEGATLGMLPAMLAPVTASSGHVVALHRTYLRSDGYKAEVPSVRKLTSAAGPLAGACIRLHQSAGGVVGIAEGIETALAASCGSGVPTMAAYCAGNLAAWQWPAGVRQLVIFGDADKAGREAARTLQSRAVRAGLRVRVLTPTTEGDDWCDVWAAGAAEISP